MAMDSITKDIGNYVLIEAADMGQGFQETEWVASDQSARTPVSA